MRIAIIGSGISGLVAAHELHPHHEIEVFESNGYIGGHTHTVTVRDVDRSLAIDTGFIVFNQHNYPRFTHLLGELGVDSHESDMSFSVNSESTGLEYRASSLDSLFAQRRNLLRPRIYRMVWDILRFFREAPTLLACEDDEVTLGEYLEHHGYSDVFVREHILPMGAALWSATRGGVRDFPARHFVRFLDNHGMLARTGRPVWRVVTGGSARYVEAITQPFRDRIRLRTPVFRLDRDPDGVTVHFGSGSCSGSCSGTVSGSSRRFDHVVVAIHSDQALRLLGNPTALETRVLGSIPYQENDVVLHTDTSILPRNRRAWAAWNHHVLSRSEDEVAVTYWMNSLQGFSASKEYLVTLNATERLDPAKIVARFSYHHPVFTKEGVAQQHLRPALGVGLHTSYCGAYWGFGFHEDGVASAQDAVREIRKQHEATPELVAPSAGRMLVPSEVVP